MVHVAGATFDFDSQSSATSQGPDDIQTVDPPDDAEAVVLTIESPPIRITFDGEDPRPDHGILLSPGEHSFSFARRMKFHSVEDDRPATVNFIWLKLRLKKHGEGRHGEEHHGEEHA